MVSAVVENGVNRRLVQPRLRNGGELVPIPLVPAVVLRPDQQRPIRFAPTAR
jgi:hypothetical protein